MIFVSSVTVLIILKDYTLHHRRRGHTGFSGHGDQQKQEEGADICCSFLLPLSPVVWADHIHVVLRDLQEIFRNFTDTDYLG